MELTWALALLLLAGCYVGWNIGANDAANCIGTAVGSGILSLRRAILITSTFAIAGALLQGHHVMKTIGKGIVLEPLGYTAVLVALFCSGIFVTAATFFRIPVSTSQAIVGGVIGVGYAAQLEVSLSKVVTILECWVLCPILTMALAFGLYHAITWGVRKLGHSHRTTRLLSMMVVLSACYVSYSMGANNVGNAMGPVAGLSGMSALLLAAIGGVALAIGTMTFGRRVTETVGKGITPLDLVGALAAQLASAVGIHLFSMMGIPVSTSQAVVGGVVGVGIVKGVGAVSGRKLMQIAVGWVAVPALAGITSYSILRVLM